MIHVSLLKHCFLGQQPLSDREDRGLCGRPLSVTRQVLQRVGGRAGLALGLTASETQTLSAISSAVAVASGELSASIWCGKKTEAFKSQVWIPAAYLGLREFMPIASSSLAYTFRKWDDAQLGVIETSAFVNWLTENKLYTLAQHSSVET